MNPGRQLAAVLRALREERGVSQATIARKASIPKATWSTLESGSANPTLSVLIKAAAALEVPVAELLHTPRADLNVRRHDELPQRRRGGVVVQELSSPAAGPVVERLTLAPGSALAGVPHARGSRELLCCTEGELELATLGRRVHLRAGDVVTFAGDRKHGYRHRAGHPARGWSVIWR